MIIERRFKPVMVALTITGFLMSSLHAIADEIAPPVQESVPVQEVPFTGVLRMEGSASNVKSEAPAMQTPQPSAVESSADNMAVYARYTTRIMTRIKEALAAQMELAQAQYRFVVHIWLARDGKVERAELQGSSGDQATDELIRKALAGMQPIAEAPPVDMPQPVKLRITSKNAGDESDNKAIHVQYVPESIKNQLREEIKQEVMARNKAEGWAVPGALPEWLDRIAFEGDLRLRYELDSFPEGNAPPSYFKSSVVRNASVIDNTTDNRNRFRVRARLGVNSKINDWLTGGIRMTTGSATDPISPNQTLNTKDSKYSFALDRAFLKAKPYPGLSVSGGRFANPFFSTDLVWDPDLALDGVAANFSPILSDSWSAFSTLGAFSMEEVQTSDTNKAKDKWMFGAQAGLEWKSDNQSSVKFGAALYDFKNVEGTANTLIPGDSTYNGTVLASRQKGNNTFDINKDGVASCGLGTTNSGCGLASKFREVNLTGQIDLAMFNPVHVILMADYVQNIGFDANDILLRTGNIYTRENHGHQVKVTVGMPETVSQNDWQVFAAYKRLEADAVLDAYTDSDFHLGGTDAKGWIAGGSYGLGKNTWLSLRWFSANEISGAPLAIDVLMFDLNAKF